MPHYRTFNEVTEEYYLNHPEEIDDFIIINMQALGYVLMPEKTLV